jgi:glycosyltransferase involved in cell wall biosynthesis
MSCRFNCRFSVIVPTFNRPKQLEECLHALARQTYPVTDFEVIVVDDGSPIPVRATLGPLPGGPLIKVLRIPNSGPGCARNVGAAAAQGRYLAFTDDDCRPAPSWLQALERSLESSPGRLIGGRTINALSENRWSATSQLIVDMVYSFNNTKPDSARFFAANNMALQADLFAQTGGFSAQAFRIASEDREFCDRWLHGGGALKFADRAIVAHAHELDMTSFCRQHFRYGRGAMLYQQLRRRRGSGRMREDIGFHLSLVPRIHDALRGGSNHGWMALLLPLILWQFANLLGFLYEWARLDRSIAEPVP